MKPLHNAGIQPDAASLGPTTDSAPSSVSQIATEEHTRRQIIWDRKMKNGTESHRHYKNTAVLLVSFEVNDLPGLDREVDDLSHIFEHCYGFEVDKKMINSTGNSQWDLIKHLSAFFSKYDSEQTLLIIYYAGHGWAPPSLHDEFNIHGKSNAAKSEINSVKWHEAENMLSYVKADIFAIFDCCNAGRLCHTRGPALWEVLGACSEGQTTEPPSPESFTRALIWALEQLRKKEKCRFSTSELRKKIKEAPYLPKNQQPPLKNRTNDSLPHIYIAPYSKGKEVNALMSPLPSANDQADVAQYFDIRLHATVVTDTLIERAAELLDQLIEPDSTKPHLAVDRITYLGSGSFNRVHQFALSWLEKARVKSNKSILQQPLKTMESTRPIVQIPNPVTLSSKLEAPPQSAVSEESMSSNATACADGKHESKVFMMGDKATPRNNSHHEGSTNAKSSLKPAAALAKSNNSNQGLVYEKETSSLKSGNTPRSSFQDETKDIGHRMGEIPIKIRRPRRGGSILRVLWSKILG